MKQVLALLCALTLASQLGASDFDDGTTRTAITLDWPVDCTLNHDCHLQQYVDHDPGPGAQDFRCHSLTYDGHKGTDIALPSLAAMTAGVTVRAAADGVVTGVRDDMADRNHRAGDDLKGRDCGNGVVVEHQGGWETQYCHLKLGTVAVTPGQKIRAGTPLGQVGLSGRTQFPHLHLSVRHDGAVVDPFAPHGASCDGSEPPQSLWRDALSYTPGGLITVGFSSAVPSFSAIKAGTADDLNLSSSAPALVVWGYLFGGRAGDQIQLQITGPAGDVITHSEVLDRTQAQLFRAAGKRLRAARWPKGAYTGTVQLFRKGTLIDSRSTRITLR